MVTISPCQTARELKLFEQLPEKIHRSEPFFIPPFPGSIRKIFTEKHPFQTHGKLIPFLAFRDRIPVGRIAAIINGAHNKYYNDRVGFFGFFDFIHDEEVALNLFDVARRELVREGFESIRGPYNPSVNDECGLLVQGFDSFPFVFMPYNPSYYLDIYEKLGLQKARDLFAFYLPSQGQAPERILKIVTRAKKSAGITVRNLDKKNLEGEFPVLVELYNKTLDRNWGFVPLTLEEMEYSSRDLREIVDPEFVLIAEKEGKPIGFSMTIPNVNEFMWRAKKFRGLLRIFKFAWHLKMSKPREMRLVILGVDPKFRNKGVASIFYLETLMRAKKKGDTMVGGELSWVEESNEEIIRVIEVMGAKRYKNYRIFEQTLRSGNT